MPSIWLISVSSSGTVANRASIKPAISSDGDYVVFASQATNLTADDTSSRYDVFLRDTIAPATERDSRANALTQGLTDSYAPAVSADGRYVAFVSTVPDLVANDTNNAADVFVYDRQTQTTERVSVATGGSQATGNSGAIDLVHGISISSDGRYVAFLSDAADLVTGDSNGGLDVFVRDRTNNTTERVSLGVSGQQAEAAAVWDSPSISGDGRYVALATEATNLFANDNNFVSDAFIYDRVNHTTQLIANPDGGQNPSISADGRFVAFQGGGALFQAGNIFVFDRVNNTITDILTLSGVDPDNFGFARSPSISGDGRFVAFYSSDTNLVAGDTNGLDDVYVFDTLTNVAKLISLTSTGALATFGDSTNPAISTDAHFVSFESTARLLPADTDNLSDIYMVDALELMLTGGPGNDTLIGTDIANTMEGNDANDSMLGGLGFDTIGGGNGNDTINGGDQGDLIFGGDGDDSIGGGMGLDTIDGGSGNDTILGALGADMIFGNLGFDEIHGNDGNDTITGGMGNDQLTGGADADSFAFASPGVANDGIDTITDFASGADTIQISAAGYGGGLVADVTPALVNVADHAAVASGPGQFIFQTSNQTLWWDANGGSGADAVEVAVLTDVATLQASDIHVVA